MANSPDKIPDAERDVLACLGRLGEGTVREIRDALIPLRKMEPASVMTLLKRLEARTLVSRRKADKGKAFVFRPAAGSQRACRNLMKDLYQSVFDGDTMAFMTSFFETRKPTEDEIEQLQQLLDDLRSEKRASKGKGK
jgi:predicted transcriptional regulator